MYLHFPWCRKRCPYCDFAIELGEPPHVAYADAVIAEFERRRGAFPTEIATIYFGGGTPSLWEPAQLARVIAAIGGSPAEVTLEANPVDCVAANLDAWAAAGIDRLSIGVQSRDATELVVLGRDHRFGDGPAAVARALAHGAFTVSADFILGTPTSRPNELAFAIEAPHLSIYELTIEERTPFGRMARDGELVPRDDDELHDLYVAAHAQLTAAGYEHYEISSYARPGHRAIHNARYWRGEPFLGLGASAASLEVHADGSAVRATNPRRADAYLAGEAPAEVAYTAEDHARELVWLGMRTSDGVTVDRLAPAIAARLVELGLAERRDDRICPTLRGFLLADRVAGMLD